MLNVFFFLGVFFFLMPLERGIFIPGTLMTIVLIGKGLVLEA